MSCVLSRTELGVERSYLAYVVRREARELHISAFGETHDSATFPRYEGGRASAIFQPAHLAFADVGVFFPSFLNSMTVRLPRRLCLFPCTAIRGFPKAIAFRG